MHCLVVDALAPRKGREPLPRSCTRVSVSVKGQAFGPSYPATATTRAAAADLHLIVARTLEHVVYAKRVKTFVYDSMDSYTTVITPNNFSPGTTPWSSTSYISTGTRGARAVLCSSIFSACATPAATDSFIGVLASCGPTRVSVRPLPA